VNEIVRRVSRWKQCNLSTRALLVSPEGAEYVGAARWPTTSSALVMGDEEGDDDVDETSDDKMVDVQTDPSLGMEDASIPLEGTAAVAEKEEHGDEQVIAEKLHNLTLDQEIQEASPESKAKSKTKSSAKAEEVMSVKILVASPTEKMQDKANLRPPSKAHWRPWE
jgi:hypothetical protein